MVTREEAKRKYECEEYAVMAHPKACFFCDHCTDIFYDYTNGPYMFICDKDHNDEIQRGLAGKCPDFYESNEEQKTMKKEYKKKKGETLGKWVERLSQDVLWQRLEPHDIQEILHDVSVTSYTEGVHTAWGE